MKQHKLEDAIIRAIARKKIKRTEIVFRMFAKHHNFDAAWAELFRTGKLGSSVGFPARREVPVFIGDKGLDALSEIERSRTGFWIIIGSIAAVVSAAGVIMQLLGFSLDRFRAFLNGLFK